MRDQGLQEAIRAVGGISELARRLGISQPSVSNWDRIPGRARALGRGGDRRCARGAAPRSFRRASPFAASTRSMRRARRNTRCSRPCLSRSPDAQLLGRLAATARRCQVRSGSRMRRSGEAAARRGRRARWAGVLRSLRRPGPRRAAALRVLLSDGLPATSARWRACAATSSVWASSRPRASRSRRITPRSCARSWPDWPAATSKLRPEPTARSSRSTWRPGSGASSAIWSSRQTADFYARVGALGRTFMEIETEAFALPQ